MTINHAGFKYLAIAKKKNMTKLIEKLFVRTLHGDSHKKEHNIWCNMKSRCANSKNPAYKYYGGRGIKVCDRWVNSYTNFLSDMGRAPSHKHSIERINNNGNYEPNNCKWATRKEQSNNQSNNRLIIYKNKSMTLAGWCDYFGLNYFTIRRRINSGWSAQSAFSMPVKTKPKK